MKNSPLNKLQQLMCITAEECGELTQRCSKMMRKYTELEQIENDQRDKFLQEVGDVYFMIDLLCEHGVIDWQHVYAQSSAKKDKLKQWSELVQ